MQHVHLRRIEVFHDCDSVCVASLVQTLGLSSASTGMFSNGAGDLVLHFITQCNSKLTEILAEQHKQIQLGQTECVHATQFIWHNPVPFASFSTFLLTLHYSFKIKSGQDMNLYTTTKKHPNLLKSHWLFHELWYYKMWAYYHLNQYWYWRI